MHHLFFFLPLPPPPTSTLFPYTTLFRSSPDRPSPPRWWRQSACPAGHAAPRARGNSCRADGALRHSCAPSDRKSTRLNSSHQIISYAVFCLKKKKKNKLTQNITTPTIIS